MKEIIKTLLLEGIDEDTIHRVLDVIEEEYEVVEELEKEGPKKFVGGDVFSAINKKANPIAQPGLQKKALKNWVEELKTAAKKELPKEKKDSFTAVNDKMNEIQAKRGITPAGNAVVNAINK